MITKSRSSFGRIPASQLRTILIIVALAVVLPLIILAAKYSQDLRSKASYSCVGKVDDVVYDSPCQISEEVEVGQGGGNQTGAEAGSGNYRVTKTGTDQPRVSPIIVTTSQTNRIDRITKGYKVADIKCKGGYTEKITSTTCLTTTALSAKAVKICNDHAVCDEPAPESCGKEIKKYTMGATCPNVSDNGETKYKTMSFTCLDGFFMDNYSLGSGSCSTSEALLNSAVKVCKGHLLQTKTFGAKCTLPNTNSARIEVAAKSISYTCTDGYKSTYTPSMCTSQSALLAKANSDCGSRLTCPDTSPSPTSLTPRATSTPMPPVTATPSTTPTPTSISCNTITATRYTISGPCPQYQDDRSNLIFYHCGNESQSRSFGSPGLCYTRRSLIDNATLECRRTCNASNPTPTPTATATPTATSTPRVVTLTPVTNQLPVLKTVTLFHGNVGKAYTVNVTAYDPDSENMTVEFSSLPFGIYNTGCRDASEPGAMARISCNLSGTPTTEGTTQIIVTLKDGVNVVKKSLYLVVDR